MKTGATVIMKWSNIVEPIVTVYIIEGWFSKLKAIFGIISRYESEL